MIKIKLKENQNGYDEVGKIVQKFWFTRVPSCTVVELEIIDNNGLDISYFREVCSPDGFCGDEIAWDGDWWEGQRNINVLSINSIYDLDLSKGVV